MNIIPERVIWGIRGYFRGGATGYKRGGIKGFFREAVRGFQEEYGEEYISSVEVSKSLSNRSTSSSNRLPSGYT